MVSSTQSTPLHPKQHAVTQLLQQVRAGDEQAAADLIPMLYRELHQMANRAMYAERQGHTLQPTVLVHEAYLQLLKTDKVDWQNKAHFLALAANTMRRVLVDHARAAKAQKRPGGHQQADLNSRLQIAEQPVEVLDLHEALERLAAFDKRSSDVVEMHFFGGLSFEEIAEALTISVRTAKRDWGAAKAWLYRELGGAQSSS
ncbi:sigma-70 family RNA polymerase sigma factor [Terriglobus sp.]|uniref:sigma-70 family RNA polymerase sigma factor n=1 Tax=Terriglobus sp. TaxID=1889013 RepID=UPI003B0086CB